MPQIIPKKHQRRVPERNRPNNIIPFPGGSAPEQYFGDRRNDGLGDGTVIHQYTVYRRGHLRLHEGFD